MACGFGDLTGCAGDLIGGLAGDAVSSAWNDVCKSFADAASSLLSAFAKAFVAIPSIDVTGAGVKNVYTMSAALAAVVCALLLIGQVIRTALTHDGSALARGLTGVGKATLACLVTLSVAAAALRASDELSAWIVNQSFGSQQALSTKIADVFAWNPNLSGALLLIMAIVGILLVVILWFELLLRSAAVAILVATAPIAAAGQTSDATRAWWPRLVSSTTQLIILKPIIALVFAVGFGLAGGSQNLESLLTGLLVLLLAVLAWPMVARFFAFASVQAGGGAGLAGLLGFAAGAAASRGGSPGVSPEAFSQAAEARTTAALEDRGAFSPALAGSGSAGGGSAPAGAAASSGGGAAKAGGTGAAAGGAAAAAAGPAGFAAAGLATAQRAVNALGGRMEQMAGHAGLQSAPYARPAGWQQQGGYGGVPSGPARQPSYVTSVHDNSAPPEDKAPYGTAPEDDPFGWDHFQPEDAAPRTASDGQEPQQPEPPASPAGEDPDKGEQQ